MTTQMIEPRKELIESVQDSLLNNTKDDDVNFSFYTYNDVPVPRVTQILKKVINKEFLLYWAANLDTKRMYVEKKKATRIGTKVHSKIEYFLANKVDENTDFSGMYASDVQSVETSYASFKSWYNNLISKGNTFVPIASELKVTCPYYGGTIDLIANINGANYIIDWKTSKYISVDYYIQTCAYMWAINSGYCPEVPHVDGIGIVRFDKNVLKYEESFLTYNNPVQCKYIDDYIATFGSLLQAYYNLVHVEQFKDIFTLEDCLMEDKYDR